MPNFAKSILHSPKFIRHLPNPVWQKKVSRSVPEIKPNAHVGEIDPR